LEVRRLLLIVVAIVGVLGASASTAAAQDGCQPGYELMTVSEVVRTIASPGSASAVAAEDLNGDGLVCITTSGSGTGQGGPAYRITDN
jgi:hypothetical protein